MALSCTLHLTLYPFSCAAPQVPLIFSSIFTPTATGGDVGAVLLVAVFWVLSGYLNTCSYLVRERLRERGWPCGWGPKGGEKGEGGSLQSSQGRACHLERHMHLMLATH